MPDLAGSGWDRTSAVEPTLVRPEGERGKEGRRSLFGTRSLFGIVEAVFGRKCMRQEKRKNTKLSTQIAQLIQA